MGNKILVGVVLLLWGSTMTWLFTSKILPPLFYGDPPETSLASRFEPTAWRIELNGKPCGVAVSQAVPGLLDTTEIHNRVKIDSLPLPAIAPKWMAGLLNQIGKVTLDMRARTTLDTLNNFSSFQTRIRVNDTPELIRMNGEVRDGKLQIDLRTGDYDKNISYPWREDRLLACELTPDAQLKNLAVGKKWRRESYSLLGTPGNPVSPIEAEVVELETLSFQGIMTPMFRIEYRSVEATGVSNEDRLRATIWVAEDGRVLRQELVLLSARLRFERMSPVESKKMASSHLELERYATAKQVGEPIDITSSKGDLAAAP